MFIIPASVVAKIMMAVTISLHPAAHHAPASYTVHQGERVRDGRPPTTARPTGPPWG